MDQGRCVIKRSLAVGGSCSVSKSVGMNDVQSCTSEAEIPGAWCVREEQGSFEFVCR